MEHETAAAAANFAELSGDLLAERDQLQTLQRIVDRAVELNPACDFSSITQKHAQGRIETLASTSEIAIECDRLQSELQEGPCLEAIEAARAYVIEDTSGDSRWPNWGPQAAARGAWSVFAVRLWHNHRAMGALNFYGSKPFAFSAEEQDLALIYASHASAALATAHRISGLEIALDTRHQIGVAQGIIMNRYEVTLESSFEVLRRYSNQTNTRLRDVARMVVETGELPEDYRPSGS